MLLEFDENYKPNDTEDTTARTRNGKETPNPKHIINCSRKGGNKSNISPEAEQSEEDSNSIFKVIFNTEFYISTTTIYNKERDHLSDNSAFLQLLYISRVLQHAN